MTGIEVLKLTGGITWTTAYVVMIRRAYLDKTSAMPLGALGPNLSWELTYAFLQPHTGPQLVIDRAWFCLDLVLCSQFLRYAPRLERGPFRSGVARLGACFAIAFPIVYTMGPELHDIGGAYSAFGMNLGMSALFCQWLQTRPDTRGMSLHAAWLKLVGTACFSLTFYLTYPFSPLLTTLYLAILVLDAVYLYGLWARLRPAPAPLG